MPFQFRHQFLLEPSSGKHRILSVFPPAPVEFLNVQQFQYRQYGSVPPPKASNIPVDCFFYGVFQQLVVVAFLPVRFPCFPDGRCGSVPASGSLSGGCGVWWQPRQTHSGCTHTSGLFCGFLFPDGAYGNPFCRSSGAA